MSVRLRQHILKRILLCSFLILGLTGVLRAESEKRELRYYNQRPLVEKVDAKAHDLGDRWNTRKRAMLESIAMLLEMYPDQELYFMARDFEYAHDLAVTLLKEMGESEQIKRIHLVNVSRANRSHDKLRKYLRDNGLNEEWIKSGREAILLDTGRGGSILNAIRRVFGEESKRIRAHFVVSTNKEIPNSRVFLTGLTPYALLKNPEEMHRIISKFEVQVFHATTNSDAFEKVDGRYEATLAPREEKSAGKVSFSKAAKFQEDIKAFGERTDVRAHFLKRREQWRTMRTLLVKGKGDELATFMKELLKSGEFFAPAMVHDFFETLKRNPISGVTHRFEGYEKIRAMADDQRVENIKKVLKDGDGEKSARPRVLADDLFADSSFLLDPEHPKTRALIRFLGKPAREGQYLSDLEADALTFDEKEGVWKFIDGIPKVSNAGGKELALYKLEEKVPSAWGMFLQKEKVRAEHLGAFLKELNRYVSKRKK